MKLHLPQYYRLTILFSVLCTLVLINPLQIIAAESTRPQASQVEATISSGAIHVVIKEENVADIIIVSAMPHIAESFVGYNDVIPGLNKAGIFEIQNETGETYKVIDYNFTAEITDLKRIYNDAAVSNFGLASQENFEKVTALSGDEWYQMNAKYFGEENFHNMDVLRKIFGWGDTTQGAALSGYETGQKMIDLGFRYLFQNCIQFSFNTNTDPVNDYDTKNIHILDYINKTGANQVLVLNKFFADEIGNEGLFMKIGYSMDNSSIGNSYNSAYADFGFELILERVVNGDMGITLQPKPEPEPEPEPEPKPEPNPRPKPRPEPDSSNPNVVGQPNASSNSSWLRDYEASSASEINPDKERPLCKNPKTGMPDHTLSISLLFVFCIAALMHKK